MSTSFILYPKLSTCSRRAIARVSRQNGRSYTYNPRGRLLGRLSRETGLSVDQVYAQLIKERQQIMRDVGAL